MIPIDAYLLISHFLAESPICLMKNETYEENEQNMLDLLLPLLHIYEQHMYLLCTLSSYSMVVMEL